MMRAGLFVSVVAGWMLAGHAAAQTAPALDAPLTAPANPAAYYADREAAMTAIEAEDYPTAEPLLDRLTGAYTLDADLWVALGDAKYELGKHDEAIAAYRNAIALGGPDYGRSRLGILLAQTAENDQNAALDTLDRMVREDAYLYRGRLREDDDVAALRDNPRFREIAGAIDVSGMSREQGWRTDLDFLVAEIHRLSPHHRNTELPPDAIAAYRRTYDNVATLSDQQIYAGMAEIIGALDMNHTMMWGIDPSSGGPERPQLRYLPVRFYFFPEGLFIVNGTGAGDATVGAQVLAIDGMPASEVYTRLRRAISAGGESEALQWAPMRLVDVALLNGLGITDRDDRARLQLRLPNGRTVTRLLNAVERPIISKLPPPRGGAAPAFLAHVPESHWFEAWSDRETLYVQVNQIAPDEDETLPEFGVRLRQAIVQSGANNVVLDLRHNNGGNTFTYTELLRTLVSFNTGGGHLYVLIGRNTYSAAANLTTDLERLANPVFVGEPTGDTGNQEGDEGAVRLPYSGLRANISGVWWQYSHPWDHRRFIAPEVPVQLHAADYFAGRDPALDVVREMIAARD